MKVPKIIKLMENIDDNLISDAVNFRMDKKIINLKYCKIVAACVAIILMFPALLLWHNMTVPDIDEGENDFLELIEEITWDDESNMGEKYVTVTFKELEYTSTGKCLDEKYISEALGDMIVNGYDECDVKHSIHVDVYGIKKIASECAIVLKFKGVDGYYIYTNRLYKPNELQRFITDLNLEETLRIYSFTNSEKVYEGCNTKEIFALIEMNEASLSEVTREELANFEKVLTISVYVPEIGCVNQGIQLYEEGYLSTNILSTRKTYWIGKENVEEVLDYVMKNCKLKNKEDILQNENIEE